MNYKRTFLLVLISFLCLTGCDWIFYLVLENKTYAKVLIQTEKDGKFDTLYPNHTIKIGSCVNTTTPKMKNVSLNYLKIITSTDTITLNGKGAIFSMLQKVESKDWRIILRDTIDGN